MSGILCWQNTTRCRNSLLESIKNGLGTGDNFLEAEGLLLGTLGGGVDKPTSKEDSSQTGHVRMIGEMGSGIRRIWNADLSPNPKLLDPRSFRQIFTQDWRLYVDGSSTQEGSGVGILLFILEGQVYQYGLRFGFLASNNVAVYEGIYEARDSTMILYSEKVKATLAQKGRVVKIVRVPREENEAYCKNQQRKLVRYWLPNSAAKTGSLQAANLTAKIANMCYGSECYFAVDNSILAGKLVRCSQHVLWQRMLLRYRQLNFDNESQIRCRQLNFDSES
ncbi:hypothetical protein NC653_037872 [Populus alba x Populus x berolinensis]|uniref:Uncharacterized protein n=1 Tax=Populus alba x Populus x berolinensis TaxID=444605 RepID=A0AAD6LF81_9ROSI|nr:hypothetical protein NC653_037872 [Populus alba x Populus x berolinensis]